VVLPLAGYECPECGHLFLVTWVGDTAASRRELVQPGERFGVSGNARGGRASERAGVVHRHADIREMNDRNPEHEYLDRLPTSLPPGQVLVHNTVRPTRRLGSRGFRAWLAPIAATGLEACDCGWARELGQHFRFSAGSFPKT
jgi:hypothetical protein